MSEFETQCPHCRSSLQASNQLIGGTVQCPFCQKKFVLYNDVKLKLELYSPMIAGMWSLLFTPVFGAWCFFRNCQLLKDAAATEKALLYLVANVYFYLFYAIIITFILCIDQTVKGIPEIIMSLSFVATIILQHWCWKEVNAHNQYLQDQKVDYKSNSFCHPVIVAIGVTWSLGLIIWIIVNNCR